MQHLHVSHFLFYVAEPFSSQRFHLTTVAFSVFKQPQQLSTFSHRESERASTTNKLELLQFAAAVQAITCIRTGTRRNEINLVVITHRFWRQTGLGRSIPNTECALITVRYTHIAFPIDLPVTGRSTVYRTAFSRPELRHYGTHTKPVQTRLAVQSHLAHSIEKHAVVPIRLFNWRFRYDPVFPTNRDSMANHGHHGARHSERATNFHCT